MIINIFYLKLYLLSNDKNNNLIEKDVDEFPVEQNLLLEAKSRVKIARDVDILERKLTKFNSNISWLEKSAEELDLVLDDEQM